MSTQVKRPAPHHQPKFKTVIDKSCMKIGMNAKKTSAETDHEEEYVKMIIVTGENG